MIDCVPIEAAKRTSGLRLVLSAIPGPPWTEAAKAVFHVKRIPYAPVAQQPVENEKPRAAWTEILFLAERLAPEPSLIPQDPEDRVRMFGLAHEICGEDGLGRIYREHLELPIRA